MCVAIPWMWPVLARMGLCGVLCLGAPEGSTGGSGFKASRKTEPRLKVSSDRLGEPGIELGTPWYKASDLSTTQRRSLCWPTYSFEQTWCIEKCVCIFSYKWFHHVSFNNGIVSQTLLHKLPSADILKWNGPNREMTVSQSVKGIL